jgi:hypothetical protein
MFQGPEYSISYRGVEKSCNNSLKLVAVNSKNTEIFRLTLHPNPACFRVGTEEQGLNILINKIQIKRD